MLDLNTARQYWISDRPTDMRKSRDTLASIVREQFGKDPKRGECAYIFYSKSLKTVKILHYSVTGYEVYTKWFDDRKCMKPVFTKMAATHKVTRAQLMLLLSGAVMTTIRID